jgi:chromosome segregation ATPase
MKKLCLLLAVSFAPAAGAAFKCVDEKGLTHIGDTPPAGCANVVMYETSASGLVLRKIDPTPTAEQLKARQDEFERTKDALKNQAEQKRKDTALLNTFSGEKEFDVVRDRNVEPIKARIKLAEERIKEVDKRSKEIEEEMEFYKAGKSKARSLAPPAQLTADLARLTTERTTLKANIVKYEAEIEQIKARFEADKKRWLALKYPTAAKPAEPDPKTDAKAAPKADAKPVKKS